MSGGRHPRRVGIQWPGGVTLDPDAQAWIARVELADGQALEAAFRTAVSDLVVYAKATASANGGTLWSRINNWILFNGPRTLAGAMVIPLKGGVQPVSVNLTAALHTRKGGIRGNDPFMRIDTGVVLPAGTPLAGGVYQTEPPSVSRGTYWSDSSTAPPNFMLGAGTNNDFLARLGTGFLLAANGVDNAPLDPNTSVYVGAVSAERSLSTNATNSWNIVRNTSGLTTRQAGPIPVDTARGAVDLFARRANDFNGLFRLGGFIQGSLSALECNDLLNRYQAAVAAHIP